MLVFGQKNFTKTSFTELVNHLILAITIMRIKLFSPGSIQRCLVFEELYVIIKIFSPFLVKKPYFFELHDSFNVLKNISLWFNFIFNGLLVIARVFVNVDLLIIVNYCFH